MKKSLLTLACMIAMTFLAPQTADAQLGKEQGHESLEGREQKPRGPKRTSCR